MRALARGERRQAFRMRIQSRRLRDFAFGIERIESRCDGDQPLRVRLIAEGSRLSAFGMRVESGGDGSPAFGVGCGSDGLGQVALRMRGNIRQRRESFRMRVVPLRASPALPHGRRARLRSRLRLRHARARRVALRQIALRMRRDAARARIQTFRVRRISARDRVSAFRLRSMSLKLVRCKPYDPSLQTKKDRRPAAILPIL